MLVVDDDDSIRYLVSVTLSLRPEFDQVAEAANGRQAVETARSILPDVIVLDHVMPFGSGISALDAIREASPSSEIVIFSSYLDAPGYRSEFADARAAGVRVIPKGRISDLEAYLMDFFAKRGRKS